MLSTRCGIDADSAPVAQCVRVGKHLISFLGFALLGLVSDTALVSDLQGRYPLGLPWLYSVGT